MHNPRRMPRDHADNIRRRISKERGRKRSPPTDANKAASLKKGSGCHKLDGQAVGKHDSSLKEPERHSTGERQEREKKDPHIADYECAEQWHDEESRGN